MAEGVDHRHAFQTDTGAAKQLQGGVFPAAGPQKHRNTGYCRRKFAPLQLLCGAGALLECVSVTNTFCHAVAPLLVSVMRTLLGVGIGLIAGVLAVLVLEGLYRLRKSR